MIGRLMERAARRAARRSLLAGRGALLRLAHPRAPSSEPVPSGGLRRVIAVRLDRLGDLVLSLPAIDDLAAARPGAELIVGRVKLLPEIRKPDTGGSCPLAITTSGDTTFVTILSMSINCCTEKVAASIAASLAWRT